MPHEIFQNAVTAYRGDDVHGFISHILAPVFQVGVAETAAVAITGQDS